VIGVEVGWGALVDLPLVLLMVWLVREMRPEGFSARFLMVPLVTLLGGLLVLRPGVVWTTWLGLALVAGASWMLVTDREE
jgi:threonine/homoserine efflux transporter RhtA